ncbi:MAG TPA: hypothetical protein VMD59_02955 [Acidimicrobiales bacterium]|nr:hypothetical protein [Acidimicrobiales bacterium]
MSLDDAAASLRSNAADAPVLLHALALRLGDVPGLAVQVSRRRGRISRLVGDIPSVNDFRLKSAPVTAIRAQVRDRVFEIEATGYGIQCSSGASTERRVVPFAQWMDELTAALTELGRLSDEEVRSLERLVSGS